MKFLIVLFMCFSSLCLTTKNVYSHDGMWYDPDCCSNKDCAPIIKVEKRIKNPVEFDLIVTTSLGRGLVTKNTSYRQSQDKENHACILKPHGDMYFEGSKIQQDVDGTVICIYTHVQN